MSLRQLAKQHLPERLVVVLRDWLGQIRDVRGFYRTRRQFGDCSAPRDLFSALQAFFRPTKTILFFPDRPASRSVAYRICAMNGYGIRTNPHRSFDVAFKLKDATYSDDVELGRIALSKEHIINAESADISKRTVGRAFAEVFGYEIEVNPTCFCGQMVEKSNSNATHDGRILKGPLPLKSVHAEKVYQRLIGNCTPNRQLAIDFRVPICGNQIPCVSIRYRPTNLRFAAAGRNDKFAKLVDWQSLFSPCEHANLLRFARRMGIDFGELDVLRDHDGRVYVVDASNTPWGPTSALPDSECKRMLALLSKALARLVDGTRPRESARPLRTAA